MINALKEKIKGKGTRIVFTEGSDPRILEAAVRYIKKSCRTSIIGKSCRNYWFCTG